MEHTVGDALSGAGVGEFRYLFLIQQAAVVIGDGLVVIASQYWGQKRIEPIRQDYRNGFEDCVRTWDIFDYFMFTVSRNNFRILYV